MRHVEFRTTGRRSEIYFHEEMKSLIQHTLKSVEMFLLTAPWPSGVVYNKHSQCELQANCTTKHSEEQEKASSFMKGFIVGMHRCQIKASILCLHFPPKWCSFGGGLSCVALLVITAEHWL